MFRAPTPPPSPEVEFFRHCRVCEQQRRVEEFESTVSRKTGRTLYRGICVHCRRVYAQKRMEEARTSIENYASVLIRRGKERAKKRGFDNISLTEGWVVAQWDKQQGLCFYSGEPMELNSGPRLVTVERLDVGRGYEKGNCVLACLCVNMMRASIHTGEFTWWCGRVAENSPIPPQIP